MIPVRWSHHIIHIHIKKVKQRSEPETMGSDARLEYNLSFLSRVCPQLPCPVDQWMRSTLCLLPSNTPTFLHISVSPFFDGIALLLTVLNSLLSACLRCFSAIHNHGYTFDFNACVSAGHPFGLTSPHLWVLQIWIAPFS